MGLCQPYDIYPDKTGEEGSVLNMYICKFLNHFPYLKTFKMKTENEIECLLLPYVFF